MTGGVAIFEFSIFTSTSVHNGNIILECDTIEVLHKKILLQQFAEEIFIRITKLEIYVLTHLP